MRQVLVLASLSLLACGTTGHQTLVFSDTASQELTSASGMLTVKVYPLADRPMCRGVNALKLMVSSNDGMPTTGLMLGMTAWMPAMGHGSAVTPTVETIDGGFIVSEISMAMAGSWECRCAFSGAMGDSATLTFDIQ
jgi:hypothetical protein